MKAKRFNFKANKFNHTKETLSERRKRLIEEVMDLSSHLEFLECDIPDKLKEIKKLKPTIKELEMDLQDLFNAYNIK